MVKLSSLERAFDFYWRNFADSALPPPRYHYPFAVMTVGGPGKGRQARLQKAGLRDWEFDVAWPQCKVAVELEGGTWTRGRHVRPQGYENDCEKYNAAIMLGWTLLRYTSTMMQNNPQAMLGQIRKALQNGR